MKGLRSITPLPQESLRGVVPSSIKGKLPKFEWVDPRTIYVEEAYQRDFAAGGTTLVRKIVGRFSWARFNPPKCVRLPDSGNILVAVDGQHTAIAAATHPDVDKIPVMIVDAASVADRADAFIGQRDRLGLTQMAIHHAAVVAGDPVAAMMDRACRKAGAVILTKPVNMKNPTKVGATIAVGTIRALALKEGEEPLARVLAVLVRAGRGPIKAEEIAATHAVLTAAGDRRIDRELSVVIGSKGMAEWSAAAAVNAAGSGRPAPIELAAIWLTSLGVEGSLPEGQGSNSTKGGAEVIVRVSKAAKASNEAAKINVPRAAPSEPPRTPSPFKLAPPKAVPAPVVSREIPPAPPQAPPVTFNGVTIDVAAGKVTHRNVEVRPEPDAVHLVGLLARVMPALVGEDRIAPKIFGSDPDRSLRLEALISRANKQVRPASLEVRKTGKIGLMLADLQG